VNIAGSKQRLYASLLILGSGVLLYRTIRLLSGDALNIFVLWVSVLLIVEMFIDLACLLSSVRWLISNDQSKESLSLRMGAAAALLHAFRVLIFVFGRTGPWINFDVRP
jgi:hypothetical protein